MQIDYNRLLSHSIVILTIYKAFIRPYLDYADIIYERPDNESFKDWFKKVQYNAALAITGGIRGISRKRFYSELGLESLAEDSIRKMTFFYKSVKNLALKYLQSYLLPQALNQYSTRSAKKNLLTALLLRTLSFSNMFFPYCINQLTASGMQILSINLKIT